MSMHTSQHLLSALLETRLGLPTLSWSLTTYPSPCYVEVPRAMSLDEVTSIQTEANKLVFEGRKVHIEVDELEEREIPIHESGRAVGRGLPDDYTGGVKRVVVIDGIDRNPCVCSFIKQSHFLTAAPIVVVVLIFRVSTIFSCFSYPIQMPLLAQAPHLPGSISSLALASLPT
jgi:misacylated tRNA(Ala) deacylase